VGIFIKYYKYIRSENKDFLCTQDQNFHLNHNDEETFTQQLS